MGIFIYISYVDCNSTQNLLTTGWMQKLADKRFNRNAFLSLLLLRPCWIVELHWIVYFKWERHQMRSDLNGIMILRYIISRQWIDARYPQTVSYLCILPASFQTLQSDLNIMSSQIIASIKAKCSKFIIVHISEFSN